jgi:hypothetical protein
MMKEGMNMLLTELTKIIRVLLAAYQPLASQDSLTQRRIGQIGEVIGAVEDVAETEEQDSPIAEKRVEEAHDIIHRIAAILAMEPDEEEEEEAAARNYENDSMEDNEDEPLAEVAWDGKIEGESIELKEDEED